MLFGYAIGLSQFELSLLGSTFSTSNKLINPSEIVDPPMINNFHVSVTIELVVSMVVVDVVGIVVAVDRQHSKNINRIENIFQKKTFLTKELIQSSSKSVLTVFFAGCTCQCRCRDCWTSHY